MILPTPKPAGPTATTKAKDNLKDKSEWRLLMNNHVLQQFD